MAGYAACLALIAAWQRRAAPERALAGVVLFGWCPQVLYATAEGAHNDLFMLVPLLLGYWLLQRGRHEQAIWALVTAALVKYIPILLLPLAAAYAYRRFGMPPFRSPAGGSARRNFISYCLLAGFGTLALTIVIFAPSGREATSWRGAAQRDVHIVTAGAGSRRAHHRGRPRPGARRCGGAHPGRRVADARRLGPMIARGRIDARRSRTRRARPAVVLLAGSMPVATTVVHRVAPRPGRAGAGRSRHARRGAPGLHADVQGARVRVPAHARWEWAGGRSRELVVAPLLLGPVWLYLAWGSCAAPARRAHHAQPGSLTTRRYHSIFRAMIRAVCCAPCTRSVSRRFSSGACTRLPGYPAPAVATGTPSSFRNG